MSGPVYMAQKEFRRQLIIFNLPDHSVEYLKFEADGRVLIDGSPETNPNTIFAAFVRWLNVMGVDYDPSKEAQQ